MVFLCFIQKMKKKYLTSQGKLQQPWRLECTWETLQTSAPRVLQLTIFPVNKISSSESHKRKITGYASQDNTKMQSYTTIDNDPK